MKKSHAIFAWLAASLTVSLTGLWLAAAPVLAKSDKDCDRPLAPKIPDGRTASAVDMIGATQRTKLYLSSTEGFLACLEEARSTVTETGRDVKIKRIDRKKDEVVQERAATVTRFNEQVRIYKLRTGEATQSDAPAGGTPPPQGSAPAPESAPAPAPDPKPN